MAGASSYWRAPTRVSWREAMLARRWKGVCKPRMQLRAFFLVGPVPGQLRRGRGRQLTAPFPHQGLQAAGAIGPGTGCPIAAIAWRESTRISPLNRSSVTPLTVGIRACCGYRCGCLFRFAGAAPAPRRKGGNKRKRRPPIPWRPDALGKREAALGDLPPHPQCTVTPPGAAMLLGDMSDRITGTRISISLIPPSCSHGAIVWQQRPQKCPSSWIASPTVCSLSCSN